MAPTKRSRKVKNLFFLDLYTSNLDRIRSVFFASQPATFKMVSGHAHSPVYVWQVNAARLVQVQTYLKRQMFPPLFFLSFIYIYLAVDRFFKFENNSRHPTCEILSDVICDDDIVR